MSVYLVLSHVPFFIPNYYQTALTTWLKMNKKKKGRNLKRHVRAKSQDKDYGRQGEQRRSGAGIRYFSPDNNLPFRER